MIPLSFIDRYTSLAGKWIYFPKLLPEVIDDCTVELGKLPSGYAFTLNVGVSVPYTEQVLYVGGTDLELSLVCTSEEWIDLGRYVRAFRLPDDLILTEDVARDDIRFFDFVMVVTSFRDMPVPEILVPMGIKYNLEVESRLIDVKPGDDLTNKVIVFDRSTTFENVNLDIIATIGNPAPADRPDVTPAWAVKFEFIGGENYINSWVRNKSESLYDNPIWRSNHIDLTPVNGNEKFIAVQAVNQDLIDQSQFIVLKSGYVCVKKPVTLSMNALEIVSNAANRLHMPQPTTLIIEPGVYENTSDAQNAVLLLAALNQTVRNIAVAASWTQLLRELTFDATQIPDNGYNNDIGGFDLDIIAPSYDGIASGYLYVPSLGLRVVHVTDEDFYDMQYTRAQDGQYGYRIFANHLCFTGEIKAPVKLLYKTKLAVKSVLGEGKELVTKDDDLCAFDSEALILGTIMFFKTSIGQDATLEGNLYGAYIKHLQSKMGAPGVIVHPSDALMTRSQYRY
jgi:hypothetical protein